jgi:hypothetical protein
MPDVPMIGEVLKAQVVWQEVTPGGVEFVAEVRGHPCKLRMNDFPDEPLYTLSVGGNKIDLDDAPAGWAFPGR